MADPVLQMRHLPQQLPRPEPKLPTVSPSCSSLLSATSFQDGLVLLFESKAVLHVAETDPRRSLLLRPTSSTSLSKPSTPTSKSSQVNPKGTPSSAETEEDDPDQVDQATTTSSSSSSPTGANSQVMFDYPLSISNDKTGGRPDRRYQDYICYEMIKDAASSSSPASSVKAVMFRETSALNMRDKAAWDLVERELCEVAQRADAGAVRIIGWPCAGVVCEEELFRVDEDGEFHYSEKERLARRIVLPGTLDTPMLVTPGSANPFLQQLASSLFKARPQTVLCIDSPTPAQCSEAAISGLLPVDLRLADRFAQAAKTGNAAELSAHLTELTSGLPPSGVVLAPPPPGSLTDNQLCAFYSLQVLGPFFPWLHPYQDQSSDLNRHVSVLQAFRSHNQPEVIGSSQYRNLTAVPAPHSSSSGIVGFARFGGDSPRGSVLLCAVNVSPLRSVFHLDCSTLDGVVDRGTNYRLNDLLHTHNAPQYLSADEAIHERHVVELAPWCSMCWLLSPAAATSSDSAIMLQQHSCVRLEGLLANSVDPRGNKVFSELSASLISPATFATLACRLPSSTVLAFSRYLDTQNKPFSVLQFLQQALGALPGDPTATSLCSALRDGEMGEVVFVSAEIGRFSTVGGVGVVVDELSQSLVNLGFHVTVISPYYNWNKFGQTGYLKKEQGFQYWGCVRTWIGQENIELGIHMGKEHGVDLIFMHNFKYFPSCYSGTDAVYRLQSTIALAKGALDTLLAVRKCAPAIILSNDWPTALCPAYAKNSFCGAFSKTKFLHVIHNAEKGYEGKIFFDHPSATFHIHQLPPPILQEVDCLNLTTAALKSADNWATVSKSYQKDLIEHSQFSSCCASFPHSFAISNGVRERERLEILRKISWNLDHDEAKRTLQGKYFGKYDPSIPVFGFVGRICEQKGVELLSWVAKEFAIRMSGKVQFIIGGFAPAGDPYAVKCAGILRSLRSQFPDSIWADPDKFFLDGGLCNLGCDYAVMPSLFEPSGVVQQEFFIGGTPVIAFKTGGLKDTVFEGSDAPNGFTFETYTHEDLRYAIERALAAYSDEKKYKQLRKNARQSVLTMATVARAWAGELCRMCSTLLPVPSSSL